MYSLVSGLLKYARRKEEYAVLLLGLDNAGKTVRVPDRAGQRGRG